ncbi:hypothetical protein IE077_002675 [Cardiosporidium cionae]|uniref:Uncharacterized protein n=1 Tax=Cardiosporidium cionae TaxID=476202 RepID=A0ABQ7JA76_9APIC|nr:hypothetical protein IE077_002675 [Cardiosporidium cionae]|eukprot:KAF8820907.1 hypothetical protein IE077_002675 [Cardiosporidium cionae]
MRFGVLRQSYRHPQTLQLINRSAINLASLSSVIHELAMAGKSSEIACFGESLAELLTGISSLTRANKNTRIRFFTNGMANEIRGRLPMYDEIISTVRAVGCYAEAVFCDILLVTRHIASKEKQQLSAFSFY